MRWGIAGLALAVSAAGCAFEVDYSGTRFRCEESADCPGGEPCTGGFCQYTAPEEDDPGGDGDGNGAVIDRDDESPREDDDVDPEPDTSDDLDEDGGDVPIEWVAQASGAVDNVLLSSVSTDTALGGDAGDLYVAAISVKPRRDVVDLAGLGLDWQPIDQHCSGRGTAKVELFWAQGAPGAAGLVSAEIEGDGAVGSAVLSVHRFRGAAPGQPIGSVSFGNTTGHDGGVVCSGGDDTDRYAWSSLDTTAPGSIVLVAAHTANFSSHTPGDGFIERADRQSGGTSTSAGVAVQEGWFPGATTDVTISGGWSAEPDWAVIAVELRD